MLLIVAVKLHTDQLKNCNYRIIDVPRTPARLWQIVTMFVIKSTITALVRAIFSIAADCSWRFTYSCRLLSFIYRYPKHTPVHRTRHEYDKWRLCLLHVWLRSSAKDYTALAIGHKFNWCCEGLPQNSVLRRQTGACTCWHSILVGLGHIDEARLIFKKS